MKIYIEKNKKKINLGWINRFFTLGKFRIEWVLSLKIFLIVDNRDVLLF